MTPHATFIRERLAAVLAQDTEIRPPRVLFAAPDARVRRIEDRAYAAGWSDGVQTGVKEARAEAARMRRAAVARAFAHGFAEGQRYEALVTEFHTNLALAPRES